MKTLMRAAAILLLISCSMAAKSQGFAVEFVRQAPLKKDALFSQAILWVAETFISQRAVLDVKDKDLGTIIGNGVTSVNVGAAFLPVSQPLSFKIRIDVKDGRYRMSFSDVRLLTSGGSRRIEDSNRQSMEPVARESFEALANSLDEYMAKPRDDF